MESSLHFPEEKASLKGEDQFKRDTNRAVEQEVVLWALPGNAAGGQEVWRHMPEFPPPRLSAAQSDAPFPRFLHCSYISHCCHPRGLSSLPRPPHWACTASSLLEGSHFFTPCSSYLASRPYHQLLRLGVPSSVGYLRGSAMSTHTCAATVTGVLNNKSIQCIKK